MRSGDRTRLPVVTVVFALLLCQAASGGLYEKMRAPFVCVADGGKPYSLIIVPDDAAFEEVVAASELQRYGSRISGILLPIVRESGSRDGVFAFYLGATGKAASAGLSPDSESMGRDGFTLRTVDDGLLVYGQNPLGTLFGVYEFLERYWDVRWFMPGEIGEVVPEKDSLTVGQIDLVFKPSFHVRRVHEGEWALHNRMNTWVQANGRDVGVKWKWHFHTFGDLVPAKVYFEEHPEYFSLINGERWANPDVTRNYANQLCTSNPKVVDLVVENLCATLDEEPDIDIIALAPNDGGFFCECDNCRALDDPNADWFGKYSGRMAVFNNQVARRVKERYPDVGILVGAYSMYYRPPADDSWRPEDNLIIEACHIYSCHNHSLESDECEAGVTYEPVEESIFGDFMPNQEFVDILKRWKELAPRLFIYEYYTIGGANKEKIPWPMIRTMRRDIPYYRSIGAECFYTQSTASTFYAHGLNTYVAAKLCWNADLDVDALLDDYFERFYGPAAEPAQAYYALLEKAHVDWGKCFSYGIYDIKGGLAYAAPEIYTDEVLESLYELVREAEYRAGDDNRFSKRVKMIRRMDTELRSAVDRWHAKRENVK